MKIGLLGRCINHNHNHNHNSLTASIGACMPMCSPVCHITFTIFISFRHTAELDVARAAVLYPLSQRDFDSCSLLYFFSPPPASIHHAALYGTASPRPM